MGLVLVSGIWYLVDRNRSTLRPQASKARVIASTINEYPMPSISFIVSTIEYSGREDRLRQVIAMLAQQQGDHEIVLVWQGQDDGRAPAFPGVKVIPVRFFSSSAARNVGASVAQGELLCFLDDDTFPVERDFLRRVSDAMRDRDIDFVTCNIASSGNVMAGEAVDRDVVLDRNSIIPHMWEPGLTIRRADFEKIGFDPTIGIGCIHGSSEGFDLGYRLLVAGYRGQRLAGLLIDHPPLDTAGDYRVERSFYYSLGNGAVLVQHRYYGTYAWQIAKTFGRFGISLLRGDRARAKASFVRALCMILGPLIPRRPARIIPLASAVAVAEQAKTIRDLAA